jgi:hypothetical protein
MKVFEVLRSCASIGGIAAVLSAGNCMAARVAGPLSQSDPDYPSENPSPARIVRVHGTISAPLTLSLTADYAATPRVGCTATSSWVAGAIEGATWPLTVRLPIDLAQHGNEYTAELAVDRFLPGRCGWHFSGVSAQVSKATQSTSRNSVIRIPDGHTPESSHYNSEPTAVVWRCRFPSGTSGPSAPSSSATRFASAVACAAPARDPEHQGKRQQILTETTTSVEFNVIDLDAP